MAEAKQPRGVNHFKLMIGGVEAAGQFREVSGLDSESEVIEDKRVNDQGRVEIRKVSGNDKWSNIELKRGIDVALDLWKWRDQVVKEGPDPARKDCQLMLMDYSMQPIATYNIKQAWPSKYVGASMNAGANEVAVESITLVHEGFERS